MIEDSLGGTFQYLIELASPTAFRGFAVAEGYIQSLSITSVNLSTLRSSRRDNWASVSSFIVGNNTPESVPAPGSAALLIALLAMIALYRGSTRLWH